EAEGEVSAMIGKVGLCLGEAAELTATRVLSDLPGEIRYRPLGVIAVVGPFNFPGHLPNGQIVPALLLGNTVVHKPSEKTPSTGTWMARCFEEAGLPSGVFNLVQGPAPVAVALVQHPDLDAILFTGSAAVGKRIVQANIERPERLIALELGGKNASIVLDDCDIEAAARQIAFAGYVTAGQRCSATSRVIATQRVAERLRKRIGDIASRIHVGYPGDPDVFMGPMISKEARAALADVGRRAEAHGFEPAPAGGELSVEGRNGWYVRPSLHLAPNPNAIFPGYTDEELFGPDMVLYTVSDLDEAIELANATRYGLVASVYTGSRERFEQAANELDTGVLHWNRSTAGASGRLPFGGIKQSGNHRPAGLTTGLSCSYAQGVLLAPRQEPLASWPGFNADSRLGS
ncbi:MAG: aldehyde dehydrogenase family protein, partial [Proteobacteria bacterium]|nr:aldehyde dehydrogenase family protein [Pseudomonadota bacterium]